MYVFDKLNSNWQIGISLEWNIWMIGIRWVKTVWGSGRDRDFYIEFHVGPVRLFSEYQTDS